MKLHKSLTLGRIQSAVERSYETTDNPGFCIYCGNEQEGCEPDAENYECDECGRDGVFGAETLLIMS
jgi:hypothetical protein